MMQPRARLVLVDDELAVQRVLATALRLEGFDVQVASDADEGWRVIERERPDAAILDVMMPGRDGLELLRQLRASELRDLPVVVLSARAQPEDLRRGHDAGADLYLTKPFDIEPLVWHLDEILRDYGSRASEREPNLLQRLRVQGPLTLEELYERHLQRSAAQTATGA